MLKDWCELNGWYNSEPLPPPAEEGEEPVPAGPVWLAKGKAMAAFRSAIAGNEEIENLMQGFQLSDRENKVHPNETRAPRTCHSLGRMSETTR